MNASPILSRPVLTGVALVALFILLDILFLGARPLFIPDEVRYGEIAREMLNSGNWIVPRLDGLLYFEKPPLGYWLNALSLHVLGENPFAVRFASALAAGVSAFTVYVLTRCLFRNRFTSLFAVFVFLTIFEVQGIATFSVLDSIFSAFLNAGIAVFVLGTDASAGRRKICHICAGLLLGMAFLTKGFLAFVLPFLILVPWLLYRKQYALLFRHTWITVGAAVLIILPWSIAIHRQQPDFWHYFFWVEHIQRFAGEHPQHEESFDYFLRFAPLVTLPWFLMAPAAAAGLIERSKETTYPPAVPLLLLWTILPLVFFSVASGKLITYILPCMVPFAVLIAAGLTGEQPNARFIRPGLAVLCLIMLLLLAALLLAQYSDLLPALFKPDEFGRLAPVTGALICAIGILVAGILTQSGVFRLLASGIAVIPLLVILPLSLPATMLEKKAPVAFLRQAGASLPPEAIAITNGSLVRATSWAIRRDDIFIIGDSGESGYGLSAPDGHARYLGPEALATLVQQSVANGIDVLITCKKECATQALGSLALQMEKNTYGDFRSYRWHTDRLPDVNGQ